MTLMDAVIVLLLAERIHGTDDAVRKSAKNMAKRLPRSERDVMHEIVNSKKPSDVLRHLAQGL